MPFARISPTRARRGEGERAEEEDEDEDEDDEIAAAEGFAASAFGAA